MWKVRWQEDKWQATLDGGATWHDLIADNEDDSSEAIDEAADQFGVATNQWDVETEN